MKLKRYIHVLCALGIVLAFSAMSAGAAQAAAPRLTVNGATPSNGAQFPFNAVSTGSENEKMEQGKEVGQLEMSFLTLTNPKGSCSVTGNLAGSVANTPATANNIVLTCKEVTVKGFEKVCQVNGALPGTVTTGKLDARAVFLAATGDTYGFTFTPETGKVFTTIVLSGSPCPLAGVHIEVEGTIVGSVETPNTDKMTQALNFPTPAITEVFNGTTRAKEADGLKIFGEAAQFTNTFDITLSSNELFGVETG